MIVLLAAVVVVCVGVVVVAVGRGGQLAEFVHDAPPLGLPVRRPIAGTDVALLRLPAGPWGYSFRSTDDALRRIAHALTERDTRIAILEQQVSELRAGQAEKEQKETDDDGSPWFDRSASFEGRPAVPPVTSGAARAGLPRTPEPAAIEAKPEPDDTAVAEPEEVEKPGTKDKPEERDEDWVFEDDVEPVVEPLGEPVRRPAPAPGDRLVASSHAPLEESAGATAVGEPDGPDDRAEAADEPGKPAESEKAEKAEDTGEAEKPGESDESDEEHADGEPRGEGH